MRRIQADHHKIAVGLGKVLSSLRTELTALHGAGERGTDIRESTVGRDLAGRYRAAHRKALQECLISQ